MNLSSGKGLTRLLLFPSLLQLVALYSDVETQQNMLASGYPLDECVIQNRQQAYYLLLHMLHQGPSKEYWWNNALASLLCSQHLDSDTPYWDADGFYSENQSPLLLAVTRGHSAIVIGSLLQKGFNASHIRKYYWMEFLQGLEPHIPSLLQLQSMNLQQRDLMMRQLKRCILLCTEQCAHSYIDHFKNIREFSRALIQRGDLLLRYWETRGTEKAAYKLRDPFAIPQVHIYGLLKLPVGEDSTRSREFLAILMSSDFLHPQVKADLVCSRSANELEALFSSALMSESLSAELLLYLLKDFNAIKALLTYHPFSRERLLWLLRVIKDSTNINEDTAKITKCAQKLLNSHS